VLVAFAVLLGLSAVAGSGVFSRLGGGGFDDPGAESMLAERLLEEEFGTGAPNVVLLVTAEDPVDGSVAVDAPAVVAAGTELTERLAGLEVIDSDDVVSYWSLGSAPPLRSEDGTRALVVGRVVGDADAVAAGIKAVHEELAETPDAVEVSVGGSGEIFEQIGTTIEGDLARAEAIAIPATLVLLVIVFAGVLAALLPLAVGVSAIFGAFGVLWVLTGFTDVSIFSINLVTALGLGLAIDYSLLIVSRFREELSRGFDVENAVIRTVLTAGRTVAFSALTVAVSLAALLVFPLYFLRSFAYGGIGVIAVAVVASLLPLPALLMLFGSRLAPKRPVQVGETRWGRLGAAVIKRRWGVVVAVTSVLVLLGLPFLAVEWGFPDDRVLPEGNSAREVSEVLRNDFASDEASAFPVVGTGGSAEVGEIEAFAAELSTLDGVARVDAATGRYIGGVVVVPAAVDPTLASYSNGQDSWFSVVPDVEPISTEAETLIGEIRDLDGPFEVAVGGASAALVDSKAAIFGLVPLAGALIAVSTFVLLFLVFGSVLVPLKAIVLNTLSLTATFGLMVWVFQWGNGAELLGFTPTGLTDTTTPILMFCIAFGLSMDYEVFLLSRMKEEYDRTGDNEAAIIAGLDKTGRIVTAAALLLSITFFAFATSGVTFIKLFGLGLGVAVLVDAFVVRATLVPALMAMAGDANWWAPGWMRRIHDRIGIDEGGDLPELEPALVSGAVRDADDRLLELTSRLRADNYS
jgi:RND superfamily putative drug exporter